MDSSRANIRSQLLASENAIPDHSEVNTMSGFANHGRTPNQVPPLPMQSPHSQNNQYNQYNQYQHEQHMSAQGNYGEYSNHDLITPVLQASARGNGTVPSSRKASMNSMSMQRLFRRKDNSGAKFDDDMGADFGDLQNPNLSFNDITHLRGAGRYNMSASGNMDTAPIIPVLGSVGSDGTKSLNNVQYRKYMNHQKKLNLAQGARAMTLSGSGNPMAEQDPRSMSFTNVPTSRTNSMGMPYQGSAPNSRAMSLNSNAMLRSPPNGHPGLGPQRIHQPMNGQVPQYMQGHPGHPNGPYGPQQAPYGRPPMQQQPGGAGNPQLPYQPQNHTMRTGGPQPFRGNVQGSRANSLNNNGGATPFYQGGPQGSRTSSMTNGNGYHPNQRPANMQTVPKSNVNSPNPNQLGGPTNPQYVHSPRIQMPFTTEKSSDSLTHVPEEEEEDEKLKTNQQEKPAESSFIFNGSANTSLPLDISDSDDNHIYRFEDHDSPQISRKSTTKKSNSMRIRKLDFFSGGPEKKYDSTSITGDPRVTHTTDKSVEGSNQANLSETGTFGRDFSELNQVNTSDSHNSTDSNPKKSQVKLRNLAQNTAFSKFRGQSSVTSVTTTPESQPSYDNSESSKGSDVENLASSDTYTAGRSMDDFAEQRSHDSSETQSNLSNYSPNVSKTSDMKALSVAGVRMGDFNAGTGETILSSKDEVKVPESNTTNSFAFHSNNMTRASSLSRSNSELKLKGLIPSSALLRANTTESASSSQEIDLEKRDKRKSVTSITSKSRNLMKRLSLSGSRRSQVDQPESEDVTQGKKRVLSEATSQKAPTPFTLTKDELSIMTCNNELQNELQLVTSELAFSIKRELALEAQLRSRAGFQDNFDSEKSNGHAELDKSKIIADLQEKLNKERKLRFISEEHAILAEHGQSPSALKLDYEKNEIYNQLLAKNDLVIQLQDKLDEVSTSRSEDTDNDLLSKFNDLLKENAELRGLVGRSKTSALSLSGLDDSSVASGSREFHHEGDQAQIMSLKTQRDELREVITKLSSSRNVELKVAQEKVKALEAKLEKVNAINHKLSKRVEKTTGANGGGRFSSGQGGKLQGFSIVSSSKNVFDE